MATLTVQRPTLQGLNPAFAAAAEAGDEFPNDGRTRLHVRNGSGGSINVTIDSPASCNQGGTHDLVVAVPASGERIIGPFPRDRFNDDSGHVQVTYSDETSVTVAVIA